jgi:hypothetical protein
MKTCPTCTHVNREGYLFCEECGENLQDVANMTLPTQNVEKIVSEVFARATWGTARFGKDARVVLQIRDFTDPIIVQPDKKTILGRTDPKTQSFPDLDLSKFGALEKGVSRLHASIYRNEDTLVLVDMGSANGTMLNGQRLVPEQPRVLRDGDEIHLGRMVMHIYFKSSPAGS